MRQGQQCLQTIANEDELAGLRKTLDIRVRALSLWLGSKAKGLKELAAANSEVVTYKMEDEWSKVITSEWEVYLEGISSGKNQRSRDGIEDVRHAAGMQEDTKSGVFAKAVEDAAGLQQAECDQSERVGIIKSLHQMTGVSVKALTQAHGHIQKRRQTQLKKDV